MDHETVEQTFSRPDPSRARAERTYSALYRITDRHGPADAARTKQQDLPMVSPYRAVELITAVKRQPGTRQRGQAGTVPTQDGAAA
jgi:hypothetical protein